MREYVLTIATRDPEHPLRQAMLIECGFSHSKALVDAFGQLAELLRMLKTPEKLAEFMRDNEALKHQVQNLIRR